MSHSNLYQLLPQMSALSESAFIEFGHNINDFIRAWLSDWGFHDSVVFEETPKCIAMISLLVVTRQDEFNSETLMEWLRTETFLLVTAGSAESMLAENSKPTLARRYLRDTLFQMDGTMASYAKAARLLGYPIHWLRKYCVVCRSHWTVFNSSAAYG